MNYEFRLAPTPAHLLSIGMVVAESTVLENVLELAIWQLEGMPPEQGLPKTMHTSFRSKSAWFLKAAKRQYRTDQDRADLRSLAKDLKTVAKQRNMIVHGSWAWGITQREPWACKFALRKGRVVGFQERFSPEKIKGIAANLCQTQDNLIAFLQAKGVEPPPYANI